MADQPSIFNNTNTSDQTQQTQATNSNGGVTQTNPDPFADLLGQIKNERGEPKYKTVQDALNGLLHAQNFISTLTAEKAQQEAELRRAQSEAEKIRTLEETLNRLTSQQTQQTQNTTPPVFDESKIAELVTRTLTAKEKEALAKQNIASVASTLQQVFGADAEQKFYGKANELGLSRDEMNALAAKSPTAALAMLGVQADKQPENNKTVLPTSGTVNTSGVQQTQQSFVGRNDKTAMVGATTDEVKIASERANKMVEELHTQGKSVHDLTDPKVYFKYFGK